MKEFTRPNDTVVAIRRSNVLPVRWGVVKSIGICSKKNNMLEKKDEV